MVGWETDRFTQALVTETSGGSQIQTVQWGSILLEHKFKDTTSMELSLTINAEGGRSLGLHLVKDMSEGPTKGYLLPLTSSTDLGIDLLNGKTKH
jgi:hypothetical protein